MYGQKQKFVGYVPAKPNKWNVIVASCICVIASAKFALAYTSNELNIQQALLYVMIVFLCYLLTDK